MHAVYFLFCDKVAFANCAIEVHSSHPSNENYLEVAKSRNDQDFSQCWNWVFINKEFYKWKTLTFTRFLPCFWPTEKFVKALKWYSIFTLVFLIYWKVTNERLHGNCWYISSRIWSMLLSSTLHNLYCHFVKW